MKGDCLFTIHSNNRVKCAQCFYGNVAEDAMTIPGFAPGRDIGFANFAAIRQ
jgi:hypothetical protein